MEGIFISYFIPFFFVFVSCFYPLLKRFFLFRDALHGRSNVTPCMDALERTLKGFCTGILYVPLGILYRILYRILRYVHTNYGHTALMQGESVQKSKLYRCFKLFALDLFALALYIILTFLFAIRIRYKYNI